MASMGVAVVVVQHWRSRPEVSLQSQDHHQGCITALGNCFTLLWRTAPPYVADSLSRDLVVATTTPLRNPGRLLHPRPLRHHRVFGSDGMDPDRLKGLVTSE